MAAAWLISDQLTFDQTVERLNAFTLQSRARIQHIDAKVNSTLEFLNALNLAREQCSAPLFKAMMQAVKASQYVYDAALQMPDGSVCSSYAYKLPKEVMPESGMNAHYLATERNYWFPRAGDVNQIFIVIAKKQAYVWINKDIFFDALQTPSSMAFQLIDATDLRPILVKDTVQFVIHPPLKSGQLTTADGHWYLSFATQWPNLLGVVSVPALEVQHAWRVNFLLALLVSGLVSLGTFHAGVAVHRRRFSLAAKIARAIRHNQMSLSYQPIVDLRTGHWRGAEALLRWTEKGQIISPAIVINEIERCGLTRELTRWVCRRVAEDYAAYFQHCEGLYITINLSAEDLADLHFADFVSALFTQHSVPPTLIVFELTESVLVDKDQATYQLLRLRALGHRIAIDDFGTGYSSLSYLEVLPIDILKIDRSFLTLNRCHAPDAMWRQVLGIAQTLNLSVVAEGVEFAEQAEVLNRAGVALAQGWLYSKALPAQQFVQQHGEVSQARLGLGT
ncbi:EAL domain-containing protein [Pseudomonas sp. NPDC087346]|uniref:EAL domain-containing protein n=1 Tax=Pseudomonas sp. NPDC087346 TaxID=3364438 RepID=UPI0037F44FDB